MNEMNDSAVLSLCSVLAKCCLVYNNNRQRGFGEQTVFIEKITKLC